MTVFLLERVTPGLRGQLTRWMLEIKAGVFVGTLSPRVREKLWKLVCSRARTGGCLLVARAPNEQGFVLASHGDTTRAILDMDGLVLVKKRAKHVATLIQPAHPPGALRGPELG